MRLSGYGIVRRREREPRDMCFIDEDDHQNSDHLPTFIQSPTTSFGSRFDDVSKSCQKDSTSSI